MLSGVITEHSRNTACPRAWEPLWIFMFPWRSVPWILKRLSDQILGVEDEGESAPWPWRMKPELCTHVFQKAYAVPYYKIQGFGVEFDSITASDFTKSGEVHARPIYPRFVGLHIMGWSLLQQKSPDNKLSPVLSSDTRWYAG